MTNKTTKRLLISVLLLSIPLFFALKFMGYHNKEDKGVIGFFGRLLNKTNDFKVTYTNIDKNAIDIVWRSDYCIADTLVKHGKTESNFSYTYGTEKFMVILNDTILCSNGFFSQNNNDTYEVEINIAKVSEGFIVTYIFDKKKRAIYLDRNRKVIKRVDLN